MQTLSRFVVGINWNIANAKNSQCTGKVCMCVHVHECVFINT